MEFKMAKCLVEQNVRIHKALVIWGENCKSFNNTAIRL